MKTLYFVSNGKRFKSLGYSLYEYLEKNYSVSNLEFIDYPTDASFDENDFVYSNYFIDSELVSPAKVISTDYGLAKCWDSKINQYTTLKNCVRLPHFKVYSDLISLIKDLDNLKKHFGLKFFIASEYSEGGDFTFVYDGHSASKIFEVFNSVRKSRLRVSRYVPIYKEISCHVIIFKDNVFLGPILEQHNEDLVRFKSIEYPLDVSNRTFERINCALMSIADKISQTKYLGVVGIDLMISEDDEIYLVEINPRKMGSSVLDSIFLEFTYGLSLPVFEYKSLNDENCPTFLNSCAHPMRWKMSMLRDLSYPETCSPGDERKIIREETNFALNYVDFYRSDDKRTFLIEGSRC